MSAVAYQLLLFWIIFHHFWVGSMTCMCIVFTISSKMLPEKNLEIAQRMRRVRSTLKEFFFFFDNIVASVLYYGVNCWRSGCSDRNRKRIGKLGQQFGFVLRRPPESVTLVGGRRLLRNLQSIVDNSFHHHLLHETLGALRNSFSQRL